MGIAAPQKVRINRTNFRQHQSRAFRQAKGQKIVEVTAWNEEDEKYLVDKRYFDEMLRQLRAAVETLRITGDPKLFAQILRASETIDSDARAGRLHSFEEAFGSK